MSQPLGSVDVTPAAVREEGLQDAAGRPTKRLPIGQLIRISLYWLGLSAVWSGFLDIVK